MNDRFRFRAWNKEDKQMYYDAQDTYDYMTGQPVIFAESFSCLLINEDTWIVEQCTGLKDKNGNLIYEGDVIKNKTMEYVVKWENCYWIVESKNNVNIGGFLDDFLHCEIIGNIHETKGEDND